MRLVKACHGSLRFGELGHVLLRQERWGIVTCVMVRQVMFGLGGVRPREVRFGRRVGSGYAGARYGTVWSGLVWQASYVTVGRVGIWCVLAVSVSCVKLCSDMLGQGS